MRVFIYIFFAAVIAGCNSSSKKNPNQAMDDTARMEHTAVNPELAVTIESVKITAAELPASIKFKGKLFEGWHWTDKMGENILILSYVAPYNDKQKNEYGEEARSAELHAFHFAKKDNSDYMQVWMLNDEEKSCSFDITCEFIKDAASVTDLNADGIAETTIQYKMSCRSDVSPSIMKVIMYEGEKKYSLRGFMWVKASDDEKFEVTEKDANLATLSGYKGTDEEYYKTFGRYESEKEFAGAPPQFLTYARQRWMKYVKESFE
jgi:hypothetical protein